MIDLKPVKYDEDGDIPIQTIRNQAKAWRVFLEWCILRGLTPKEPGNHALEQVLNFITKNSDFRVT